MNEKYERLHATLLDVEEEKEKMEEMLISLPTNNEGTNDGNDEGNSKRNNGKTKKNNRGRVTEYHPDKELQKRLEKLEAELTTSESSITT